MGRLSDKNHWPDWGKMQCERKGCATCHSIDGTRSQGPSWKGIWGKMEKMNDGPMVLVDEAYVRESMMQPQAKIVQGFEPIMPTFQGLLQEQNSGSDRVHQVVASKEDGDDSLWKHSSVNINSEDMARTVRPARGRKRITSTRPAASGAG